MADECINCGGELPDDPVYAQSGIKDDGAEQLADGETVGMDELFEMDDGPYCSLDCSIKSDD